MIAQTILFHKHMKWSTHSESIKKPIKITKQIYNALPQLRITPQIECSTTENQSVFSTTPFSTSTSTLVKPHFTPVLKPHKTLPSTPELKHFPNLKRTPSATHQINSEFKNNPSS